LREFIKKRKRIAATGGIVVVLVLVVVGVWCLKKNKPKEQQAMVEQDATYQSLSESDKETATIYAELYEMSSEEVAKIYVETTDWEKSAKELEKEFFTIDENIKYQMTKEGYSLDDLEEAEKLSTQTGRKAMELIKAKGKIEDKREWSDVVSESEILTVEGQLGLTKEQIQTLKDMSVKENDRVDIAVMILNEKYSFEEVESMLKKGMSVEKIRNKKN
jgi:hypothetical protein